MPSRLKYVPFRSFVDSGFFQQLADRKLNAYGLDASAKPTAAYYAVRTHAVSEAPTATLSDASLDNDPDAILRALPPASALPARGAVMNVNTREQFQGLDKNRFLADAGAALYAAIADGRVAEDPSLLVAFALLCFSDLKKFKFYYWFAFPSLYTEWVVDALVPVADRDLDDKMQRWLADPSVPPQKKGFFLLDALDRPLPLSELVLDDKRNSAARVGIVDASTYDSTPAWYLRNFLAFLLYHGYSLGIEVLVYRSNGSSFWLTVSAAESTRALSIRQTVPRVTGWEKTSAGALQPKYADLLALLSPVALAEQAVDLNLKLMKWRIAPQIQLEPVKQTRCLILGAGTLGSYVARALLGWGVRHITFVDNGRVSFSNPVRQPLYTYEDCLDGGVLKAAAAARALKQILPQVHAQGHNLEIPMIGHPVKDPQGERENFELLQKLVREHDVVFLLMDSRETRWLPTVMGIVENKIVVNAALGFDSFLVMRHGNLKPQNLDWLETESHGDGSEPEEHRLGCYFCNDVFAPSDSLTDRTLDQMCTVTRPGVALLASALAVELMVSIIQHPQKQYAPAPSKEDPASKEASTILGELPHQVRGFLHNFTNIKLLAPNYKHCSACSVPVLRAYREHGWDFVMRALNNKNYVEDLSGLTIVQEEAERAALAFEVKEGDDGSIDDEWL